MKELIECGTLANAGEYSPILCDPITGDVVYDSDIMGRILFSDITVADPLCMPYEAIMKIARGIENEADGVICTNTYIIFLKDGIATYRRNYSSNKVEHTVKYSLDIEYED